MTVDESAASGLSPDEAFALVADETRLGILRTLAEAGEPLAFSTLFERSEYDTRSNFSYHLEKLEGHFISRADGGYALRQTGRRIVEAVVSGTVTDDPVVERAPSDRPCPICSAPIEVSYQQERVEMYCSECPGIVRQEASGEQFDAEFGTLGHIYLPPAGVQGRTPAEMHYAAEVWSNLELLGLSTGVCPRCSGTIEHSLRVCEDHDASGGFCDACDRRYAVLFEVECATCHYETSGIAVIGLLAKTELLSFVTDHDANPLVPETHNVEPGALANYEEDVQSLDPLRVAITFTIKGDSLTLTIDEAMSVVDVTRARRVDSA
ncbi:helix-turn-helix domain-containing protein [Salinirubellus salinus]|uniref:Helix-turn-helix domain-containing protein n=1 Tax=Salinirubellus salinus TaxID=1364945 RepID=A0A9E7QZ96_9EURY|nr:helix-turn-helix domain-containing protein [Salinirubellus salinus]UWM52790.1 helix-turn-helix domain-containing protein [Salinirubellus salinus]